MKNRDPSMRETGDRFAENIEERIQVNPGAVPPAQGGGPGYGGYGTAGGAGVPLLGKRPGRAARIALAVAAGLIVIGAISLIAFWRP